MSYLSLLVFIVHCVNTEGACPINFSIKDAFGSYVNAKHASLEYLLNFMILLIHKLYQSCTYISLFLLEMKSFTHKSIKL